MGAALKSSQKYGLMDQEIGQTILPKLLDGRKLELTLALLTIILEIEGVEPDLRTLLIEIHNHTFDENEMEQILQWIEATQH